MGRSAKDNITVEYTDMSDSRPSTIESASINDPEFEEVDDELLGQEK